MKFDDLFVKTRNSTMDNEAYNNQARKFPHTSAPESKNWLPGKKYRYQDVMLFNPDTRQQQQQLQAQLTQKSILGRGSKQHGANFNPLSWFRRHPKLIMVTSYIAVLFIGAACGFVPFIKVYMDDCKADRQAVVDMIRHAKKFQTAPVPRQADFVLGSKATEQLGVSLKKGSAPSEKQIELSCDGDIIILHLTYKGVKSVKKTIRDAQNYCDSHVYQIKDSGNKCFVSLPNIYGVATEMYKGGITEIYYTCL